MKTLYIIRHAKSDQSFLQNDFDRPLNERGKKDATAMAKKMLLQQHKIDAFISSPAKRAKTTAEYFAQEYKALTDEIIFVDALYHAAAEVFFEVIKNIPDEIKNVAIFSHNPSITHFVNELTDSTRINDMPTCGIFAIQYNGYWTDFKKSKKSFLFFDFPKNY